MVFGQMDVDVDTAFWGITIIGEFEPVEVEVLIDCRRIVLERGGKR